MCVIQVTCTKANCSMNRFYEYTYKQYKRITMDKKHGNTMIKMCVQNARGDLNVIPKI